MASAQLVPLSQFQVNLKFVLSIKQNSAKKMGPYCNTKAFIKTDNEVIVGGRLGQALAKDCRPLSFSQHRRGLHTFFIPYLEPCPNIPQICWQILHKYF